MIGIYKLTNTINGYSYVGQSRDIARRFREHRTYRSSYHFETDLQKDIREYGRDSFDYSVLEECELDQLDDRERYWIATLKPEYNKCEGGSGCWGHTVSEETRKVLSQKGKAWWASLPEEMKGRIIRNLTGQPIGHPVSAETREKLRQANLGKKRSAETIEKQKQTMLEKKRNGYKQTNSGHKKKVYCVETNVVYNSVRETAEAMGLKASAISHVLHGRQENTHGYHFTFVV